MMKKRKSFAAILLAVCALVAFSYGANCSLRNPDREIYQLFSNANHYRSNVGKVDLKVRAEVESTIGFKLTFSDLGQHTLYTVYENNVPSGFVHSRSEVGKNGVIELVWAISIDLKIVGFKLQRCRSSSRSEIVNSDFMKSLQNKDYVEVSNMLNTVDQLELSHNAQDLASDIIKSAAKALVITRIAFDEIVLNDRLVANVHRWFPGTREIQQVELESRAFSGAENGKPHDLIVLRSVGLVQEQLGSLVFYLKDGCEYWWALSNDGETSHGIVVGLSDLSANHALIDVREMLGELM